MEAMQDSSGNFTPGLLLDVGLIVVCAFAICLLNDPPVAVTQSQLEDGV
jgi:hypothetical protein